MAVDYLRRPERSDFYTSCSKQAQRCKKRCVHRASTHGNLSLVACKKRCSLAEQMCQSKHNRHYDRSLVEWKARQKEMRQSLLCRRVEYIGSSRPECVVVAKYFHFTYRINRGAAWGIFSNLPSHVRRPFFISITLIAILFIMFLFVFRLETEHRFMVIALSLILGGALGNFLDRVRLDYVIDFIEWFWQSRRYTWPTFNIADTAISIGVVLIAIELFFFAPSDEDESRESTPSAKEEPSQGGASTPAKDRPFESAPSNKEAPSQGGASTPAEGSTKSPHPSISGATLPSETPSPESSPRSEPASDSGVVSSVNLSRPWRPSQKRLAAVPGTASPKEPVSEKAASPRRSSWKRLQVGSSSSVSWGAQGLPASDETEDADDEKGDSSEKDT